MAKTPFGGKGRPPAPTSAFGAARPKKPAAFGGAMATPSPTMGGGLPSSGALGGLPGGAAPFAHGGGVQGGGVRQHRLMSHDHDCPTLGNASKANFTKSLAKCNGGKV